MNKERKAREHADYTEQKTKEKESTEEQVGNRARGRESVQANYQAIVAEFSKCPRPSSLGMTCITSLAITGHPQCCNQRENTDTARGHAHTL